MSRHPYDDQFPQSDWTQYGRQPQPQPSQQYPQPQPQPQQPPQRVYVTVRPRQPNILLRTLYFVLIGWWAGALWALAAILCCITIIGLPVGLAMLNRLGFILTLRE